MSGRAAGIRLRKQPVDAAIDNLDRAMDGIQEELDLLARRVARLEAEWDGEARRAFSAAMSDCRAQLVELHRIGAAFSRVARASVTRLDDFDRRRASAWQR